MQGKDREMEKRIVMVVDKAKNDKLPIDIARNDLEGNSAEQTRHLKMTLENVSQVICYESVTEFAKHLDEHRNDVVFPMYYGPASYNSKGVVPSLCETYGINYIGADAYAQLICNDKMLSKQYASNFRICSPKGYVLRPHVSPDAVLTELNHLNLPLVVKPNVGGGSTGISANSIVHSHNDAIELARFLINKLQVPILIEEYIEGYEVELITVGSQKRITFCEEVQLLMGSKTYFDHDLWSFETKNTDDSSIAFTMSQYISSRDRDNLLTLFQSFDKLEMIRFDGRIKNGCFYLIELSPDCYLGNDCAFYYAFQEKGYSHSEMFRFLINNSLNQN